MTDNNESVLIRVSAPGKVILHGEHSVVYGKLAVAASLGLRTRVELTEIEPEAGRQDVISLEFPSINLLHFYNLKDIKKLLDQPLPLSKIPSSAYNFTQPELLQHDECLKAISLFIKQKGGTRPLDAAQHQALTSFFYAFWGVVGSTDAQIEPFKLTLSSELTVGAGTGSSASFAVSIVGAFVRYVRVKNAKSKNFYKPIRNADGSDGFDKFELDLISKWAFQLEKIVHGTPSGVDNAVCTYGGLVEFRKGGSLKLVEIATRFSVILINTNVSRETKTLVKKVATLKDKYQMIVDGILELIDQTTTDALGHMQKINRMGDAFDAMEHYEKLGELTDFNQNLLRCLGVSHPKLDEACQILAENGLHGKLTGAGGGGYAICLVSPSTDKNAVIRVIDDLNSKGFNATLTDLGGVGVSVHSK